MSQGASFADPGYPIRLAKTTALHATGTTQDVTLMWGDKGAETEGTADRDTVPAYNRYGNIDEDEEVLIARVGPGWEILNRSTNTSESCGACTEVAGTGTIDLGGSLFASEFYGFDPFCSGVLDIVFEFDAGGVWNGDAAGGMSVNCTGESATAFTATLTVTGHLPGQVVVDLTAGGDTWSFENDVSWQPDQNVPLLLSSGPASCPCAPFRQFPCLRPLSEGL